MSASKIPVLAFVLLFLLLPGLCSSDYSVVSGFIHGSEPQNPDSFYACRSGPIPLSYVRVPFKMSAGGNYRIFSAGVSLDPYFAVYAGAFDPAHPEQGLIGRLDVESWFFGIPLTVTLVSQALQHYELVVAPGCVLEKGAWTIIFEGPGQVLSPATVEIDPFTRGALPINGDTFDNSICGQRPYRLSGPHRVPRTGPYFFTNTGAWIEREICLTIFPAPPDTLDPSTDWVAVMAHTQMWTPLSADQDYYFAVQTLEPEAMGEYLFLIQAANEIYIDPVFSGSYYNPDTPGQGFFLDVFGHDRQVFLGWYTFDLERPVAGTAAQLGEPGHRWLTAFGTYSGDKARLDVELTQGGVFDRFSPSPSQYPEGEIRLRFFDCLNGRIRYSLPGVGRDGTIPIRRLSAGAARECEQLMAKAVRPIRLE